MQNVLHFREQNFFFAGKIHLEMGRAQSTPNSFPLIFSRKTRMAGMNKRETVENSAELVRQNPYIYDQSLAEHTDSIWESITDEM